MTDSEWKYLEEFARLIDVGVGIYCSGAPENDARSQGAKAVQRLAQQLLGVYKAEHDLPAQVATELSNGLEPVDRLVEYCRSVTDVEDDAQNLLGELR